MIKRVWCIGILVLFVSSSVGQDHFTEYEKNWPHWRGPYANGVSPNGDPPVEWSEVKNIRWKVELPGFGHSTLTVIAVVSSAYTFGFRLVMVCGCQ